MRGAPGTDRIAALIAVCSLARPARHAFFRVFALSVKKPPSASVKLQEFAHYLMETRTVGA
jgi:hypothetical protein